MPQGKRKNALSKNSAQRKNRPSSPVLDLYLEKLGELGLENNWEVF
jgi:hypothetical protein